MTRVTIFPVNRTSGKINVTNDTHTITSWIQEDGIMNRLLAMVLNIDPESPDTCTPSDQDSLEVVCVYDELGNIANEPVSDIYLVCELEQCLPVDDRVLMASVTDGMRDRIMDIVPGPARSWVFIQRRLEKVLGPNADSSYLTLLKELTDLSRHDGAERSNRTDIDTVGAFAKQIRIDISDGQFPLLTTKRVPFRLAAEELLWFARGETNSKVLEERGVNIWKGNSSRAFLDKQGLFNLEEGDIGPGYGWQWRRFGEPYNGHNGPSGSGFDQLAYVENLLKTDPMSRRILMCAWAPHQLKDMALPPCHVMAQWYVNNTNANGVNELSCMLTMRSCDTFLGLPWNIASYALLTYILAAKCDMIPNELVVNMGDCHLYVNCIEQAKLQITRDPGISPKIIVDTTVREKAWEDIKTSDFAIYGYYPQPVIKADMAV